MELTAEIISQIENADHKALATYGAEGINVVPISVVKMVAGNIWIHNFFMNKTVKNVKENPNAALVFWSGFNGVQVKGEAVYENSGERFEAAKAWIDEHHPDKLLYGLIVLSPKEVFDISAGVTAGEKLM